MSKQIGIFLDNKRYDGRTVSPALVKIKHIMAHARYPPVYTSLHQFVPSTLQRAERPAVSRTRPGGRFWPWATADRRDQHRLELPHHQREQWERKEVLEWNLLRSRGTRSLEDRRRRQRERKEEKRGSSWGGELENWGKRQKVKYKRKVKRRLESKCKNYGRKEKTKCASSQKKEIKHNKQLEGGKKKRQGSPLERWGWRLKAETWVAIYFFELKKW